MPFRTSLATATTNNGGGIDLVEELFDIPERMDKGRLNIQDATDSSQWHGARAKQRLLAYELLTLSDTIRQTVHMEAYCFNDS